ncbi:helix-turn-helix domain-containing protein [Sharpea porci]
MMESGFTNISEIAHSCGFSDSNYFSRYFKKKTGISPKQAWILFK